MIESTWRMAEDNGKMNLMIYCNEWKIKVISTRKENTTVFKTRKFKINPRNLTN